MRRTLLLVALIALGCAGRSVVGGPPDGATTTDLGADLAFDVVVDTGMDVPPVDRPTADVGVPRCNRDDDCRGHELGLFACDVASGRCVACTPSFDTCPSGQYCEGTTFRCVAGCRDDSACARPGDDGGASSLRCNTATRQCVACTTDAHCPAGRVCAGNECVAGCSPTQACPAATTCCTGACVDSQSNTAHCGGCGMACAIANGAAACVGGACAVATCTGRFADCDSTAGNGCETDTSVDVMHCGGCGRACAARANSTASCAMGACAYACNAGFADCDSDPSNGCEVTLATDAMHCGACGNACMVASGTAACVAGACGVSACADGFANCDGDASNGCEVDTRTTLTHCGACGTVCPTPTNAAATCATGACGLRCNDGFGDCDSDATNGCEVTLGSSTAHCGRCGAACPARANATTTCGGGACAFTCDAGYADCDGEATNGCETDTRTTVANCGTCGNACPAGARSTATCAGSACGLTCAGAYLNCDGVATNGCEVDPLSSAAHCGACNNACASGRQCEAGLCCGVRERNCGGVCRNLNTENANCGACGNVCPTNTTCTYGVCESNTCLPTRSCSGSACNVCGTQAFVEPWDSTTAWRTVDGGPIVVMSDASACRGSFMRETVLFSGGRTFTRAGIPVRAGQVYCLSAWIRGSASTQPFLGINASNAGGTVGTEHWLIGNECYPSGFSVPVSPVRPDGLWHWYAREFTMPSYTHVVLKTEIFQAGSPGTADFDAIQLVDGRCPEAPPAVCAPSTCD